ncbi:hypothetical protein [Halalkalibacter hemicellulosilyticus]|uniref:Uncharacterized protein n=1 Tax=Halalkalibacter hemicellulosilyticusJCM 9152 TaxID=1236971 RepID=W4QE95_9BACI|nr:hypothetical protein [Halalkalibacter hemicellulosilyticus]GAE29978.1 hypothetical protein JCM9152_1368 [Halalkalibacter hemicellulosilyticusJCM 9152]
MGFWNKERFKSDWQQAKKDSERAYQQKHQSQSQTNKSKASYAQSKTHKIILSFTYAITVPFLGLIIGSMFSEIGATIGWFIGGLIGFTGLISVWKRSK